MDHSLVQRNETMSHAVCFSVYDKDYSGPQNLKNLLSGPLQRKKSAHSWPRPMSSPCRWGKRSPGGHVTCPSSPRDLHTDKKRTYSGMWVGRTQCPRNEAQAGLSSLLAGLPPVPGEIQADTGYLLSEYPSHGK